MKIKYLLIVALVVVLGSCSSSYRTGQTPDDVYYSPVPAQETYVVRGNSDERDSYNYPNSEEREIRRAIRDPRYRAVISSNVGYGYNPYMYNPYAYSPFGYSNFGYNPYGYNNYYGYKGYYDPFGYNPYNSYYGGYYPSYGYSPIIVGKTSNNTGPRKYNLGAYNTPSSPTRSFAPVPSTKTGRVNPSSAPLRTFDRTAPSPVKPREKTGVGNVIRRVFTPSDNREYTAPSNDRSNTRPTRSTPPVRTFDPPTRNTTPSRSFDAPARSVSPPASNTPSSSPVRSFRNN